jgi:hypothetical protein
MVIVLHNFVVLVNYFIIKGGLWSKSKEVIVFEEKEKDKKDWYLEDEDEIRCYCGICYSVQMITGLFTRRLLINTHSVE